MLSTVAIFCLIFPVFWTIGTSLKEDYEIAKGSLNFIPPMPKELTVNVDYSEYYTEYLNDKSPQDEMTASLQKDLAFAATQLAMSMDRDSIFGLKINAVAGGKLIYSLKVPKYKLKYVGKVVVMHHGLRINPSRLDGAWDDIKGFYSFKDYLAEPVSIDMESPNPYLNEEKVKTSLTGVKLPEQGTLYSISIKNDPLRIFDNLFASLLRFSGKGVYSSVEKSGIVRYTLNTFMLTIISFFGALLFNGFAGYGLAKLLHKKYGKPILLYFLTTMMIPGMLTLIPYYLMFSNMGLLNSYWALIIPAFLGTSPFWIYLFIGFFGALPNELFDSARIDGANELKVFYSICIPLSKPIISVLAMNVFLNVWNDFLWPVLVVNDYKYYTIPLLLYKYRMPGENGISQSIVMSLYTLIAIPCLFALLLFNKYIEKGIVFTGIKG